MALTRPRFSQLNTSVITSADPVTVLNQGASSANVDVGFLFNRANGLVSNVALYWSESTQSIVTAYTDDSGASGNIAPTAYANLTVGNVLLVNGGIIGIVGNLQTGNLIANTGIYAPAYYYANGAPFVSSTYGNTEVAAYLPLDATITTIESRIDGANAAIVTANTSLKSYTDAIVSGANAAIITANTELKSYTDSQISAVTSAWQANAATQDSSLTLLGVRVDAANTAAQSYTNAAITNLINSAPGTLDTLGEIAANLADGSSAVASIVNSISNTNSNVAAANSAIATLQTQVYSNTNVAAYLPVYTGAVGAIGSNHIGTGTFLTSLNASNLSSGTVPANRISGSYPNITEIGILTTIDVTGTASIGGNLDVAGNLNIASGNITISNSGSFIGNAVTGYGALYAGIPSGYTVLPSTPLQIATNDNTYSQLNMQNINAGSYASSDYVVTADNGSDSTYYGDFGIASSNFDWPELGLTAVGANDVYLLGVGYSANGPYTGNVGNVVISSSNGLIKLASGGANIANVVATVHGTGMSVESTTTSTSTSTGALTVAGGLGVAGNVYAGAVYTSGLRWSANGAIIQTGSKYTVDTSAPSSPTVGDKWFNSSTDIVYEYQDVGTGQFWIDISGAVLVASGATVSTGDTLSPFLLMGA